MRMGLLGVLLAAAPAFAAFEDAGWSPRAIAMGSAFTAVSGDASAAAYNPAGLGQPKGYQYSSNYLRQLHIPAGEVDQDQMNMALIVPIRQELLNGGFGLTWLYTDQEKLSIDRSVGVGYGTRGFMEFDRATLDIGGGLKILSRNLRGGGGSTKPDLDFGMLLRFGDRYAAGLSVLNLNGPRLDTGSVGDRVPATLRVGIAETVRNFTWALDFSKREPSGGHRGAAVVAAGLEYWAATARAGTFAARAGLGMGEALKTFNYGAGWRIFGGQLDYAMTLPLSGTPRLSHAVSMMFRFGEADPEREYERLLKDELRYRQGLTDSLEAAEVRQWKLSEELARLREQLEALQGELEGRKASESEARARLKALQDRHKAAQDSYEKVKEEARRLKEKTKEELYREDWASYQRMKSQGAPDAALADQVKRILRQYKDTGVDLGPANQELLRLLRKP